MLVSRTAKRATNSTSTVALPPGRRRFAPNAADAYPKTGQQVTMLDVTTGSATVKPGGTIPVWGNPNRFATARSSTSGSDRTMSCAAFPRRGWGWRSPPSRSSRSGIPCSSQGGIDVRTLAFATLAVALAAAPALAQGAWGQMEPDIENCTKLGAAMHPGAEAYKEQGLWPES